MKLKSFFLLSIIFLILVEFLVYSLEESSKKLNEEDSDIEFETPTKHSHNIPRKQQRQKVVKTKKTSGEKESEESDHLNHEADVNEFDDDLGEIHEGGSKSADGQAAPSPQRVQRWRKQRHFFLEMSFLTWIVWALFVYTTGKIENAKLVQKWLSHNMPILQQQFTLVGDDGNFTQQVQQPKIIRENAASLTLYCSGRRNCGSCLFRFDLCSRQDAISALFNTFARTRDELEITIEFDNHDVNAPFIFAIVPARSAETYKDSHADLAKYAINKGVGYKGLHKHQQLFCDSEQAFIQLLDPSIRELINSNSKYFHSIHFTDEASFEDTRSKKVMKVRFYLPKSDKMEELDTLMKMVFNLIDRVPHVKLNEKEFHAVRQIRDAEKIENKKQEALKAQEEILKKKMEARKKEKEAEEAKLETLPPDQRRKLEMKIEKRERKRQLSGKSKVQIVMS
eukprot:c7988_g1_i1.p1 GENE.c7988_g1_i1~~c7988_g1_i1.p1  ORF type:complete len:452 (+),score=173.72 c7988_g1_i1:473-1828(+)